MSGVQYLADNVHRSVVAALSTRHAEIARQPVAPVHGYARRPDAIADAWFDSIAADLRRAKHDKAYDDDAIRAHAENYASLCSRMGSLESRQSFAVQCGVALPGNKVTRAASCARLDDPLWWRHQLRKTWTRSSDDALREIGMVRRGGQAYISDAAVEHYIARQRRTREWMESRELVSEAGDALPMVEVHDKSLANKALRRGEMMARTRGFEEYGEKHGFVALFLTLTTPSRFHAQLSGGGANPAWEAARLTVRDGQQWLCDMWEKARAKLARLAVLYFGFRIAEPHHDGTPHWHALLFVRPHHAETLSFVVRQYWLSDAGHEPGAQRHRVKCDPVDKSKGSAVGYIAKYIAKNIDAFGAVGDAVSDETGRPVSESVMRIPVWASVHGIRQFQQLGGPAVGIYRELRRQRTPFDSLLLESVRAPADAGKVCEFIEAQGGMERARRRVGSVRETFRRAVRLPRVLSEERGPRGGKRYRAARPDELPAVFLDRAEPRAVDVAGRDVVASTRYGEPAGLRPVGVCSYGLMGRYQSADTRLHRWRIERAKATAEESEARRTAVCVPGIRAHGPIGRDGRIHECAGTIAGRHAGGDGASGGAGGGGGIAGGIRLGERREVERAQSALVREIESARASALRSALGPVAITVRSEPQGPDRPTGVDLSWVMTVPFRGSAPSLSNPQGWTSRETSMAGPVVLQ